MIQNERNYGIDSLRIASMVMVVMLHVLGAGGVLAHTKFGSPAYFGAWGIENVIFCAVNCYALISGFVGIYSKFKLKNIIALWMQVEFFSVGIGVALYLMFPGIFGVGDLLKSALPVLFERYWYFTAYFGMFFFIPFMNRFVLSTAKDSLKKFLAVSLIIFSILPTLVDKDVFYSMNGYSMIWLALMYVLGAYIRHYGLWQNRKSVFLMSVFAAAIACNWIVKFGLAFLSVRLTGAENSHTDVLLEYTSPTIIVASVALLIMFSRLRFNALGLALVKFFAPLAFGVYIVHMQPMIWQALGDAPFAWLAEGAFLKSVAMFIGIVAAVYLVSSMAEWIRRLLFNLLRIHAFEVWLADKIYCLFNRLFTRF